MILTGNEIYRQHLRGSIVIDPFCETNINPNSYNFRLGEHYTTINDSNVRTIPESGLVLIPNQLYLMNTYEVVGSDYFVTMLNGRSSIGRLGLFLNISADMSNVGSIHKWTLELHCVQKLIVYPRMKIGQATFWETAGLINLYDGEYAKFSTPQNTIRDLRYE